MNKKIILLILCTSIAAVVTAGCTQLNNVTHHKYINVNSTQVKNSSINYYFSEEKENPDVQLINVINSGNKTVHMAVYSLTKRDIVNSIIAAKKRGLDIKIITDKKESSMRSEAVELQLLKQNSITIKVNTFDGLMHDKFTIVDGKTISTGSFNYSDSAVYKNYENMVVIKDPTIANGFDNEFSKMWNDTSNFTNY